VEDFFLGLVLGLCLFVFLFCFFLFFNNHVFGQALGLPGGFKDVLEDFAFNERDLFLDFD
jgi:hypothetical protein